MHHSLCNYRYDYFSFPKAAVDLFHNCRMDSSVINNCFQQIRQVHHFLSNFSGFSQIEAADMWKMLWVGDSCSENNTGAAEEAI